MENTFENAIDFADEFVGSNVQLGYKPTTRIPEMLVAYASACSAPSSIGEGEDILGEMDKVFPSTIAQLGRKMNADEHGEGKEINMFLENAYKKEGAIWMYGRLRSRLSERKIVLPSEEEKQRIYLKMYPEMREEDGYDTDFEEAWTAAIESVLRLNGIN